MAKNNVFTFRKKLICALIFLLIFTAVFISMVLVGSILTGNRFDAPAHYARQMAIAASAKEEGVSSIILDAGHGGIDSGAVGISRSIEKELNLDIVLRTQKHLTLLGYEVLLTRDGDYMLDSGSSRSKKLSDVTGRVAFAADYPDAYFISIHMNTNPNKSCRGSQLYFSKNNSASKPLALTLEAVIKELLQPDNKREAKAAGSNIFILDRITSPAILLECGFISNYADDELLSDELYREKLAFSIAYSVYKYDNMKIKDS